MLHIFRLKSLFHLYHFKELRIDTLCFIQENKKKQFFFLSAG